MYSTRRVQTSEIFSRSFQTVGRVAVRGTRPARSRSVGNKAGGECVRTQVELHLVPQEENHWGNDYELELRNDDVAEMLKMAEGLAFRKRWA